MKRARKVYRKPPAFYLKSQGSNLFAEIERYASDFNKILAKAFPKHKFEQTGAFRRHADIIDKLEWVTTVPTKELQTFFTKEGYIEEEVLTETCSFSTPENILLQFYSRPKSIFLIYSFETTASEEFINEWNKLAKKDSSTFNSEEEIFSKHGINSIPPFLREKPSIIPKAKNNSFKNIIQPEDITAIIHSHSDWSDGSNTIEQMAKACIEQGYEYLVISDHSKQRCLCQRTL